MTVRVRATVKARVRATVKVKVRATAKVKVKVENANTGARTFLIFCNVGFCRSISAKIRDGLQN